MILADYFLTLDELHGWTPLHILAKKGVPPFIKDMMTTLVVQNQSLFLRLFITDGEQMFCNFVSAMSQVLKNALFLYPFLKKITEDLP